MDRTRSLPGTSTIKIKLIFHARSDPRGTVSGGDTVGEMINIASLAIQKGMTATELNTFQVAMHPLPASPIAYPINAASMNAIAQNCRHLNEGLVIQNSIKIYQVNAVLYWVAT